MVRLRNQKVLRWIIALFALIGLLCLPLGVLYIQSEYFRFIAGEQMTHKLSKIHQLKWVFLGDSITAGGRNWGSRLGDGPLNSINLGVNGYTIRQVVTLLPKALDYHSHFIVITAGTNDLLIDSVDDEAILSDWSRLMSVIPQERKTEVIVCSIPIMRDSGFDSRIAGLNSRLKLLAEERGMIFVDINTSMLGSGIERDLIFVDGVHLSEKAYRVWAGQLSGIQANRKN